MPLGLKEASLQRRVMHHHNTILESSHAAPRLKTLRDLWPYLWPAGETQIRLRLVGAVMCLIVAKCATLMVPLFFKESIDHLSLPVSALSLPVFAIVAYGLARLLTSLFNEFRDALFIYTAQRAVRYVGLKVFQHIHALGLGFHLNRRTGGLSRAIERGTKAIESLLQFLTFNIIPTILEILMVTSIMWMLYGGVFASVVVLTLGLYIAFTLQFTQWRIHFIQQMNRMDNEAGTRVIDSLLNFETVKYFNNEAHEAACYDEALKSYQAAAIKSKLSLSLLNIGQAIISAGGLVAVMLFAAKRVQSGGLSVGDFVALNTYLLQLYIPLFNLGFSYREVKLATVNMGQMFELLNAEPEVQDDEQARDIKYKAGEISFQNVVFGYDVQRPILRGVSFSVPPGETLAIVGASGAGKSTISRLLFRFYDVSQGAILIDGQNIQAVTQKSVRHLIGIVPQDTVLFNASIGYNIAYGNPDADREATIQAAKAAHIHDFIQQLPEGYDTRVGERGLKLSGGEKQRIAIARTFLKQPKIFLFDEATSALDTHTEQEIQNSLRHISHNHTTIIIAHRLSTVVDAHQILVLEDGVVVEQGTHHALLGQAGTYAQMWQRQQEN